MNGVGVSRSKHHRGTTMDHYAGIDVSLECASVCIVDASGKIVREGKVSSEPQALIGWFGGFGLKLARIGLEAGPLSQWLYAGMKEAGLTMELLETRHVRTALATMPVKSDRNDARGIAQLMRLGWFRPVHCKSVSAQEIRALLTARRLVQSKLLDLENSLRGILRGFGLKVGKTTNRSFAGRVEELVINHSSLRTIATALLSVHAALWRELKAFEKQVRAMARSEAKTRLLMSTPAVGPIVALTYASAIDDPRRFKSSKRVGAHFGLTPKKYQSGETDYTGRISKIGDASVRTALYEAAHIMMIKPIKGCSGLKSWAMKIARRGGTKKAKVALARKLAVILHRMLANGTPFNAAMAAAA
jgi:transposase